MYDIETLEEFLKFWINHGWIPSIKQDRVKQYLKQLEDLIKENKELKEEKVLNEKILYFANNTLCNYQEGYQAGLHKEITATEIVAEEREKFIIGQEIKRLKDTIHELHNQLDEGNKRVKEDYIPKSKVKEKMQKDIKINEHVILGGRRNGKTLEYGKRLGRIEMCEELLGGE